LHPARDGSLEGKVFVDYLSRLKQQRIQRPSFKNNSANRLSAFDKLSDASLSPA